MTGLEDESIRPRAGRRTFVRLLGFLRPYRASLVVSSLLAIGSQVAGILVPVLTGVVIDELSSDPDTSVLAFEIAGGHRPRARARGAHARPPLHLRAAGARGRVRPARRALRPLPATVVRVLRPQPDGAAHVAGDDRPPVRALLPRLRADLLRAARRDDRRRDRGPLRLQLAARARRARDHARDRARRIPLQQGLAPGAARRAAEARRRRHGRRGVDRRRARRQVVLAGGASGGAASRRRRTRSSSGRSRRTGSVRSTSRS